jgi:hypothetical protein
MALDTELERAAAHRVRDVREVVLGRRLILDFGF